MTHKFKVGDIVIITKPDPDVYVDTEELVGSITRVLAISDLITRDMYNGEGLNVVIDTTYITGFESNQTILESCLELVKPA